MMSPAEIKKWFHEQQDTLKVMEKEYDKNITRPERYNHKLDPYFKLEWKKSLGIQRTICNILFCVLKEGKNKMPHKQVISKKYKFNNLK